MSETKHTPGPWVTGHKHVVGPRSEADDQSFGMIIPVADIYGENSGADARLIAAAPELLATMRQVADIMRNNLGRQDEKLADVEPLLRAAIAKASGTSA